MLVKSAGYKECMLIKSVGKSSPDQGGVKRGVSALC